MSDYDPNRIDPTRRDPKRPAMNEAAYAANTGFNWNWIIGGIAALAVLLLAMSFLSRDDQTAETGQPPAATTGQSSSPSSSAPPSSTANPAPTVPNARPDNTPADRAVPRPATPNQ